VEQGYSVAAPGGVDETAEVLFWEALDVFLVALVLWAAASYFHPVLPSLVSDFA